jgi:enterobactin synthetase component D / holo-[acyl-carrier protein] synthase
VFEEATPHGFLAAIALPEAHEADARALLERLPPEERRLAERFGVARAVTFAGGRIALRAALARAGAGDPPPILSTDRGAPLVPAGLLGSISHKSRIACALAARAEPRLTIGVDVEQIGAATERVTELIMTSPERAAIAHLTAEARQVAIARAMSLKESIYKALDPIVRRYVGFHEVEVWPDDIGGARVACMLDPAPPGELSFDARWFSRAGHVFTSVALRIDRASS